jgi:hypothetical protein
VGIEIHDLASRLSLGAAATYTLPTAALIDAAVPNATVGSTFDL